MFQLVEHLLPRSFVPQTQGWKEKTNTLMYSVPVSGV